MLLALLIGGTLLLLLLRVPVAFALLVPSLVYLGLDDSISVTSAFQRMAAGINVFALLAVPLFIMTSNLFIMTSNTANAAGITDRLFGFAERLLATSGAASGT